MKITGEMLLLRSLALICVGHCKKYILHVLGSSIYLRNNFPVVYSQFFFLQMTLKNNIGCVLMIYIYIYIIQFNILNVSKIGL